MPSSSSQRTSRREVAVASLPTPSVRSHRGVLEWQLALQSAVAAGALSQVAPFRARLRQSSRPEYVAQGRVPLAVCRRGAVQSAWSGLHRRNEHSMISLPNNAFEPTLESSATSLRVGCGAAQRKR
jgi:hypothetical protein